MKKSILPFGALFATTFAESRLFSPADRRGASLPVPDLLVDKRTKAPVGSERGVNDLGCVADTDGRIKHNGDGTFHRDGIVTSPPGTRGFELAMAGAGA